jgi:hypothetical protein
MDGSGYQEDAGTAFAQDPFSLLSFEWHNGTIILSENRRIGRTALDP